MASERGCRATRAEGRQWQSHGPLMHVAIRRRDTPPSGRGGFGINHPARIRSVPVLHAHAPARGVIPAGDADLVDARAALDRVRLAAALVEVEGVDALLGGQPDDLG